MEVLEERDEGERIWVSELYEPEVALLCEYLDLEEVREEKEKLFLELIHFFTGVEETCH